MERLEQLVDTTPETDPAAAERQSALDAAEERADATRERGLAARGQRQQYAEAMTTAREEADELRSDLEETREREDSLAQELVRAEGAVARAEHALRRADGDLRRETRARDAVQDQVRGIERDVNAVRRELSEQARRHSQAWGRLPGFVSTLETGRRAEGTGTGPSLLSSVSSAPARPTRSGRFGGQPLPAPPAEERVTAEASAPAGPTPSFAPTPSSAPTPQADLSPAELADLATRLPAMPEQERTSRLLPLSPKDREALAADRGLAAALRQALPTEEFARTAALLMVDVPAGVDLRVSAGLEARAQVARMLRSAAVAESLLNEGARMTVVPKDAAMTSLDAFHTLRGGSTEDARPFDTERGTHLDGHVAATEENLLGGTTSVPGAGLYRDGYSTTTHEFAHAIHHYGLTDGQRRLILEAFNAKVKAGSFAQWPDGSLYDASGKHRNYSARDEFEYFAQLTNVYLGTNTGTDPYTGRPRNNGAKWIRSHEPNLLPLLQELYGTNPRGSHPWQSNPRQEEDVWAGFRAMWDEAENAYQPQPHAPVPAPPQTAVPRTPTRAALTAARGPVRLLDRGELARLVRRVAGRGPVRGMSVERCLVLLRALRDELYGGDVRPAVALDDAAIGRTSAESSLVMGPGWRGVRSWDVVKDAVTAAGPGAAALVLARRQGEAPGHAWAAYHLGGTDGVVWVDVSAGAHGQVSAFPPEVAPSDARAVVIDPAGRAIDPDGPLVEGALPVFAPSSSTAHAVLDAATGRRYGALGLEVEKRQVFVITGMGDVPSKQVLATAPGFKIVTDHAGLYRTADGQLHLTYPQVAPGEPKPKQGSYLIGEIVVEPMAVLPGERRQSPEVALARLERVGLALDARDEPNAVPSSLEALLPAGDGWKVTALGEKAMVGPTPVRSNLAYVQPTTGFPALGLSVLQDAAVDRMPKGSVGAVEASGREFGMKVTAEFVRALTRRSDVPDMVVPLLVAIPDVDDLWGYLRFAYAHTVARPTGVILNQAPTSFMVKNGLAVGSRPALDRVLRAVRPGNRVFLDNHHDSISENLAAVLGKLLELYRRTITPDKPFFPGFFDATIGDVPSPREHVTSVLTGRTSEGKVVTQKQMVDMDDDLYPTLDTDDGRLEIPLVLTELRHFAYDGQLMTPEEIRRAVAELSQLSREAYERAEVFAAPLPEDVLREAIVRILDDPAVRGLAVFVQMVLMAGVPQADAGPRRLMSVGDSQKVARALGAYALGTPLPDGLHQVLRTAVDEATGLLDTAPPQNQPMLRRLVERARVALDILADPAQTPPVLPMVSEIVAVDGSRVLLERMLAVKHRDAGGRVVGVSSRPVRDWQDARRQVYGSLPEVAGYTLVRQGPVPLESPVFPLPFGTAHLVGLRGDASAAALALSDGTDAVFDYARIVDFLFAVDGHLTAASPETAALVSGADLAGPPVADPLDVPLAGQVLANGMARWVWATGSGLEPVLVPGDGTLGTRLQLAEGDWWAGFRPEPSTAELGRLAERVTGARERAPDVLRWVRAIRLVYGPLLENDTAAFEALLGGFWALERARAANGIQSPLTWGDLRLAIGSYFGAQGQAVPPLPVALQFLLVSAAASVDVDLELSGLSLVPQHQSVRAWDRTPAGGGAVQDEEMSLFAPSSGPAAPAPAVNLPAPAAVSGRFTGPNDAMLSSRTVITGPSGRPQGRNWTKESVSRVLPGRMRVIESWPGVAPKIASIESAPWPDDAYVVAAEGENGRVRLPDGRVLDAEGIADALAADPELAKLAKDVPVVLAIPFAGERYQEMLRVVADRLGRTVWGPSGEGRLVSDGTGNAHVLALMDPDPDAPVGAWVSVPPSVGTRYVDREWTALDGTTFRDSDVLTRPLADESHERFGRVAIAQPDALRRQERRFRRFRQMRRILHRVPAGDDRQTVDSEEITPDPAIYVYASHGLPGRMELPLRNGRTVWLDKRDAAAYIAGLREVRELPPGHRVHLEVCWSESDGDPRQEQPPYSSAPHVDDPLEDVPLDQYVANLSLRETEGATRQTGLNDTERVALGAADGERGRRVRRRPEPLDYDLDRLARDAGLHDGPGAVSPETRATTLRLVRALRRVFGNEIEDHRGVPGGRYERVLKGIAALERMRANDPAISQFAPFRLDMLDLFVREHSGRAPDLAGYVALLDFAAARVAADSGAKLTEAVPAPVVQITLKQLADKGEQMTRYVQSLPAPRRSPSGMWRRRSGPWPVPRRSSVR